MRNRLPMVLMLGMFLAAGCGNTGWVLKPVALGEALKEAVVSRDPGWFVTDKILVLDVDGLLFNERRKGLFSSGENPVSLLVEKLDKAQQDEQIKALVIRINSPGGGVTASNIMYERIRRFRMVRNIPVIAIIEDIGASGGYYIACAAETIIAHPTSVTGSIGTIVQTISVSGTMKLLRIDAKAVTSGPRKDMASPFKPLDPEDLAILQGMVDEYYLGFLRVVAGSRSNLDPEQIKKLSDGRVFTGTQAKANGLVDQIGFLWDAIALAKRRADLTRAKVIIYHRPLGYRTNVYSAAPTGGSAPQFSLINISPEEILSPLSPKFLYLWTGHTYR